MPASAPPVVSTFTSSSPIHSCPATGASELVSLSRLEPAFPANDVERGEFFAQTSVFSADQDQSCVHCHYRDTSDGRKWSVSQVMGQSRGGEERTGTLPRNQTAHEEEEDALKVPGTEDKGEGGADGEEVGRHHSIPEDATGVMAGQVANDSPLPNMPGVEPCHLSHPIEGNGHSDVDKVFGYPRPPEQAIGMPD
mgnify:CR=1 FL=1